MSLLAMDTSSLFDPFAFDPPEMDPEPKPVTKFREKLEIKPLRHQEHHMKAMMASRDHEVKSQEVMDVKIRQQEGLDVKSRQYDLLPKVQMLDSPPSITGQAASDMQSVRQKLRDSLTSALEMVVSKQLVKSVLGVVKDAKEECGGGRNSSIVEGLESDTLLQELGSLKPSGGSDNDLVVDLGLLDSDAMNIDASGGDGLFPDHYLYSGGEQRANGENAEHIEGTDVAESPLKKLKTEYGQSDFFHRKLEIEEMEGRLAVENVKGGLHLMDQAKKLAIDVEAELFKLYGCKKMYNQKARSLLFNLKDKSNPELRARVFSGEITPADLCRMSAEQLASKELSDWRNAKEQALAKWVVLTDADTISGKVVKKTHKGEFVVDVQNENTVDIIPHVNRSVFPVRNENVEEKLESEASDQVEVHDDDAVFSRGLESPNKLKDGSSPSLKRSRSEESTQVELAQLIPDRTAEEQVSLGYALDRTDSQLIEVGNALPTILSLDEYMDAQEEGGGVQEDVFADAPIEPRDSVTPNCISGMHDTADISVPSNSRKVGEDDGVTNHVRSPGVKPSEVSNELLKQPSEPEKGSGEEVGVAWAGQIQLSSNRQSPFLIMHRSGEKVELNNWPKSLELKGRVRLAHLDKFLQDLQQSRSRAVTVVSLFLQEGHADRKALAAHVKEIASQYQMGDRVGFVEPRSGHELYLLPPGSGTANLLSEHGHSEISAEAQGREVVLVGVIVWRRSQLLSSSSSRLPDRNNNVKRHAVASSTHHHDSISKSSRAGVGLGKDPGSDHRPSLRGATTTNVSSALSSMHPLTKFQVESPTKEDPRPPLRNWPTATTSLSNPHHVAPATNSPPSDATADMPPGFTPRPTDSVTLKLSPSLSLPTAEDAPPGFWPRPAQSTPARQPLSEDDDLPEFDFANQRGLPPAAAVGQFPVVGPPPPTDSSPHLSSQFQASNPSEVRSHLAPSHSEFPPPAGFPPRPAGPPPAQDPPAVLPRNPPPFFNPAGPGGGPVGSSLTVNGRPENEYRNFPQDPQRVVSQRVGQGQVMVGQPGPPALPPPPPQQQQPSIAQYGGANSCIHGAPSLGNYIPRNDLPEWRPSAQFQLRPPPPLYENDPRHMGGAPPRPLFDPAGTPPPPRQEMNWPPQQQLLPPPPLPLPPPPPLPQFLQEQPRNFQPQWQQHPNHFQQQQQHIAVDARGPYGWDAGPWEANARERELVRSHERSRENRSSGHDEQGDPRGTSELSWHERERDSGRLGFRRR